MTERTKSSRGVRKVNPKRRAKNWPRQFHSDARVKFVNSLRCVAAKDRCSPYRDNHHVKSRGAGGTYQVIVTVCEAHHRQLHAMGRETFERHHGIDLDKAAVETQKRWLEFSGEIG